ncbi:hypothetical protein [Streptomyces guryensis]|uniref:Uncharacterized protein n=1 Tax=Streptomyces guryensis TaxID=2886947 RepID=A0A9Q3VVU9_9ACTN|nr:hypothetical protein [Streptomyces guryensis]MCD9880908.1 hypothetical protein [Streptomyces guryensis]
MAQLLLPRDGPSRNPPQHPVGALGLIQQLLALDLERLADQAALALALHTIAVAVPPSPEHPTTGPGKAAPTLDELLALPRVVAWAQHQFRPLHAQQVEYAEFRGRQLERLTGHTGLEALGVEPQQAVVVDAFPSSLR